jgi:hypothetical protein
MARIAKIAVKAIHLAWIAIYTAEIAKIAVKAINTARIAI